MSKSYFYRKNLYSRKVNVRLKVCSSKFKGSKARLRIPQSMPGMVTYAFRFGFRFLYVQEPEIWRRTNMGGWMRLQLRLWWWTPRTLQMYRQVSSQDPPYSPLTTNCVYWSVYTPITCNFIAIITLSSTWRVCWFKNVLNQWLRSISIFTPPEYNDLFIFLFFLQIEFWHNFFFKLNISI